jgi:hypothetical protein
MKHSKLTASAIAAAAFAIGSVATTSTAFAHAKKKAPSADAKASCGGKEGCGKKDSKMPEPKVEAQKEPAPGEHTCGAK